MNPAAISVVIVSIGRPDALRRCLLGLWQQASAGAEVIVVADRAGLAAAGTLPFAARLKAYAQERPNISEARNLGIARAAGRIVAFLDDDAVPEPTWIQALAGAFADADVAAVTGPVLGRNGISVQWGPMAVDATAKDFETEPEAPVRDRQARKLHGTNMAMRRSVFEVLGGFDPAFSYYLDDTDMALRIAGAGLRTAWAPGAVVHHGFASSVRRTADRVPLSLHDIGASAAVFLRKHARAQAGAEAMRRIEAEQASRLLRLARARKIDAAQMRGLMEGLRAGAEAGASRNSTHPAIGAAPAGHEPLRDSDPPSPAVLAGRPWHLAGLRRDAAARVLAGQGVSLFVFAPTPRRHRVRFTDGGWWEQSGGQFGASARVGPAIRLMTFRARLAAECRRISATRGI